MVCQGLGRPPRTASEAEVVVRAGAACIPVAAAGGWIATQYVNDHIFSLVVPGLVGFACALAAGAVNRRRDRDAMVAMLTVAAVGGVLGTALGFHLVPGGRQSVFRPANVVVAPYLCAVVGAVAWRLLFGAERRDSNI
jgi:peptidoglycan/LPS O-acetylase OafA/YrhL